MPTVPPDKRKPHYGNCDVCGVKGCYPYAHDELLTDEQALRYAKSTYGSNHGYPRADDLARYIIAKLTGKDPDAR